MKNMFIKIMMLASMLLLPGCASRGAAAKAPVVRCPSLITVEYGTDFHYKEACRVEGQSQATPIDTYQMGTQTLRITSQRDGSFTLVTTLVNVVPEGKADVTARTEYLANDPEPLPEDMVDEEPEETSEPTPTPTPTPTPEPELKPETPDVIEEEGDTIVLPSGQLINIPKNDEGSESENNSGSNSGGHSNSGNNNSGSSNNTPSQPDYGHGTQIFHQDDYGGDVFAARDACVAKLNQIGYGSCYPDAVETYYTLEY